MRTLSDVLAALDRLYPPATALSWDRVGLVTGDPGQPVAHVHFAVDATLEVIQEAIDRGADLLVTHHPLLLRGVHSVATTSAKGRAVTRAIRAGLAIYCAHTNADVADPGVCDALADACGLTDVEPLAVQDGQSLGRLGTLAEPMTLRAFAELLVTALPPTSVGVRVSGPPDAPVRRVAVLGGAGDSFIGAVRRCGADAYVTADLRHHPALEAREESDYGPPYLVDAGHWATEWLWLDGAARRLAGLLAGGAGAACLEPPDTVSTTISTLRTDPWDFLVGVNAETVATDEPGGAP